MTQSKQIKSQSSQIKSQSNEIKPQVKAEPRSLAAHASMRPQGDVMPKVIKEAPKRYNFFRKFSIMTVGLWLLVFALLPHAGLLLIALLDRGGANFVVPVMTLGNYGRLFDPVFVRILWDSIALAATSTLVCLVIGYPFAHRIAMARESVRPWLLLLVIIPFWTNSLIRTYALIILLKSRGVISNTLEFFGLIDKPISLMYSDIATFTGLTYTLLPFMILPLYVSLDKLDHKLIDAAKDLGASSFRAFWHVTLPLTLPGIVAGCMLVFLPSLGAFYIPEMLGGAKSMLIGNFIKNQFLVARDWPLGAAASSILTFLLLLLILVYRFTSKRVAARDTHDSDDELFGEGA